MLNRRILRIKAFKTLYAYAQNQDLTLKEALDSLDRSCEAVREEYLLLMALIPALTAEAARRTEAARSKFHPTDEDLHPNMRFVENRMAQILEADPDFQRLLEKKKLSWENADALLFNLYDTLRGRQYFQAYLDAPEDSLKADARLWCRVFSEELEDHPQLNAILEDGCIHWADDLPYALGTCLLSLEEMGRSGRWSYPPLYQSDILKARGKEGVESDRDFVHKLLSSAYGRFEQYYRQVAGSVSQWDRDRLYVTDIVLIALGLAEAETFPDIPARVTINEYVEIAKYYSTPKSRTFVNGLLDKLIKENNNNKLV